MDSNRGECWWTIFSKERAVRTAGYMFLCMLLLAKETGAEKSVLECDNMSGELFYDPITKRCICDRSKCFKNIIPKSWNVTEERCTKLTINCDPGMEPARNETECKRCPNGKYKPSKGCDDCVSWTKCNETEWILFPGNNTMDRKCSTTAPEIFDTTISKDYNKSPVTSSVGLRVENTDPDVAHEISKVNTSTDELDQRERPNTYGSNISGDLLYIISVLCGLIFLGVLVIACFTEKCQTPEERQKHTDEESEVDSVNKRFDQTYVVQEEGSQRSETQTLLPAAARESIDVNQDFVTREHLQQAEDREETSQKTRFASSTSESSGYPWSLIDDNLRSGL